MMAADFGQIEAGKILLDRGANINCLDTVSYALASSNILMREFLTLSFEILALCLQRATILCCALDRVFSLGITLLNEGHYTL